MVWQQALYLVNLLCKFVPCDYHFPYPDTSLSEQQAFKSQITLGFDGIGTGQLDSVGLDGWDKDSNSWMKEHDYTQSDSLVVITKTGKLRGYWMKAVGGRKIRAFEGVPYAEPPIGYFRFHAPAPKIPWTGLFHATKKGPKCLQLGQIELQRVVGSEDCLCMNLYTPQVHTRSGASWRNATKFPVLIYFHGGGWLVGSGGDYGPAYLLQQDLILVTFNWRVGVIGFMSTGDSKAPGNYGLKDQALAVKWVYENIEYFNGDPTRITLFGQEAGGASVHLHMISSGSQPYFQSGVSMSGTAFNHWVLHDREKAKELTKHLSKKLNCPIHSTEAIVACLRRVDAYELVKTQIKFLDDWPLPVYLFRPVIEDKDQPEAFLIETPEEAYGNNRAARIPWISGFTEDEGLTFLLPIVFRGTIKHLRSHWNTLAADFLDLEDLNMDLDAVTRKINWLYFKQQGPQTASIKTFSDALSTRFTITGVHKALQAHCLTAPTYAYMFSYNGKYNLATMAGIRPNEWGVGQGEDVFYLLNSTHLYQGFKKSDHELILSKIMVNLFGNFVSKRYPTFTLENNEDFQIWNPITDPRNMSFLMIHKKIKMIPEPYLKSTIYWESLGLPDTIRLINSTEHNIQYLQHTLPSATISSSVTKIGSYATSQPSHFDLSRIQIIPSPTSPSVSTIILPPARPDNINDIFLKPETDIFDLRSLITTRSFSSTTTTVAPNVTTSTTTTKVPKTSTTESTSTTTPFPSIEPDKGDQIKSDVYREEEGIYLPPWIPPTFKSMAYETSTTTTSTIAPDLSTPKESLEITPFNTLSLDEKDFEMKEEVTSNSSSVDNENEPNIPIKITDQDDKLNLDVDIGSNDTLGLTKDLIVTNNDNVEPIPDNVTIAPDIDKISSTFDPFPTETISTPETSTISPNSYNSGSYGILDRDMYSLHGRLNSSISDSETYNIM